MPTSTPGVTETIILLLSCDLVISIVFQLLSVNMEMYVWLVVVTDQEEWRYVSMEYGVQYVMTNGILMMLEWFADNLDYQL